MLRKPHQYHYIYKTTCKITENYYHGMRSSSKLDDEHLGSDKRLRYSIRKHGEINKKSLEEIYSQMDLS